MPYFELHLFRAGSAQPFASLPRSTSPLGSFSSGESISVGTGPGLTIAKVAHRCLPGSDNETLYQTALVISGQAASLAGDRVPEPWAPASGGDFVPWPPLADGGNADPPGGPVFEGVASTLEEAVKLAHAQVPLRPHRDFTVAKVVGWGMQRGGYTDQTRFYVQVVEDADAHLRPDGPDSKKLELLGGDSVGNG